MDKRDEITETPAESQSVENKSAVTISNEKSIWKRGNIYSSKWDFG